MALNNLVVDTNIFIEYLRAKDKLKTTLISIPDHTAIFISSVTLYELYMGAASEEKKTDIRLLTDDLQILPFNESVAIKASEIFHDLRKSNQLIEFRDIFIAATSIVFDIGLKTSNTKHFKRIQGLRLSR